MSKPSSQSGSKVPTRLTTQTTSRIASRTSLAQKSTAEISSKVTSRRASAKSISKTSSASNTGSSANIASAAASNRSSTTSKRQKSEASLSRSESKRESVGEDARVAQESVVDETVGAKEEVASPIADELAMEADVQEEETPPALPSSGGDTVEETAVISAPDIATVVENPVPVVQENEPETNASSEEKLSAEAHSTPPINEPVDEIVLEETPVTRKDSQEETNININSKMHVQSQEDLEDDYTYSDDQVNITTVTARLIESPLPSTEDDGFMFINVDYEADPDLPVIKMCSGLSRTGSWDWGLEKALHGDELVLVDACITPIMRPSTPVLAVHDDPVEIQEGEDAEEVQHRELEMKIDQMLPEDTEDLDREEIITQIRDLIDMRDKYMAKNANYQNLLGEYFRRKRV
jgi:hypothetical protein